MLSSDSQPIQFWDVDDETFNEKDVCGLSRQDCFCQIFQTDDTIVVQLQEVGGDAGLVAIRVVDQNGNIVGGIQMTNENGYQSASFSPADVGMVSGGKYYLEIDLQGELEAAYASFTLTGFDATFPITKEITAEYASFSLTGQDVELSVQHNMNADYGSFVLSGQDVELIGPLSAVASPDVAIASGSSSVAIPLTTNSTTTTAFGGQSPYTYLWEYVSGALSIVCDSDSTATTTFSDPAVGCGNIPVTGVWRCKVTDNLSTIVYSNDVNISLVNTETTCA